MVQKITLDLSDSAIQHAEAIAHRTGRPLEAVIADWVEWGAAHADLTALASTEQYLYTPLGGAETAQALYEFLKSQESTADR